MALPVDVQVGKGYLHGIAGSITLTPAGGSDLGVNANMESMSTNEQFTMDEIPDQTGTIIEAAVASKRFRDFTVRFMFKSNSAVANTRANAETAVDTFRAAMTPLAVITIAVCTVSDFNGTYNYIGGLNIEQTRDGKVTATFNARQYETATANTFAALALVTG